MTDRVQVVNDYTLTDALYDAAVSGELTIGFNIEQGLWEVGLDHHGASNPDLQDALLNVLAEAGGTA